jgi:membrane protein YqaA with SNARE-associated domain
MGLWALITATFFIQEFATTALVLVLAEHSSIPLWPIHIVWAATTLADMYIGYLFGNLLKRRLSKNKFVEWIDKSARRAMKALGSHGANIGLMILGVVNFPYLNAFIGAWLDMPMNMTFLFTFIGNFAWYLLLWGTVLGLTSFIHNPSIILLIIVAIGIFAHFGVKAFDHAQRTKHQ